MTSTIIDGAELLDGPYPSSARHSSMLSSDRRFLAVIRLAADGRYRVHVHRRLTDPYFRGGVGWTEAGDPSEVHSLDDAERLARERLENPEL